MIDDVLAARQKWHVAQGDALALLKSMPDESVQVCVTSPPYFQLRNYGIGGQIGLEPTVEEYVAKLVEVFRDVRRVLRNDGICWIVLGDSFQNKQLLGAPWRVAFALQTDGWRLRSDIIWNKPNCMPSSVTDRVTTAHEYVFMLSKSANYYFDAVAVAEPSITGDPRRPYTSLGAWALDGRPEDQRHGGEQRRTDASSRNLRSVWTISTESFDGAHFATFPTELVKRCIAAGSSEHGACSECGAPYRRIVERKRSGESLRLTSGSKNESFLISRFGSPRLGHNIKDSTHTIGWQSTCQHNDAEVRPCIVLDPFAGSGTTLLTALRLGRRAIGLELNGDYVILARNRIINDAPMFNRQEVTP